MSERTQTWRIGELAKQAGITVRTLHHYDRLGLLSPSSRTSGGHRCYTRDDVTRLQRIIALRSCGLALQDIGVVMRDDAGGGVTAFLRRQLDMVNERIRQSVALQARLLGILDRLERNIEPSITDLLQLIEETTIMNTPWTAEQVARLKEARVQQAREMNPEAFAALAEKRHQAWVTLNRDQQTLLVARRGATLPAHDDTRR